MTSVLVRPAAGAVHRLLRIAARHARLLSPTCSPFATASAGTGRPDTAACRCRAQGTAGFQGGFRRPGNCTTHDGYRTQRRRVRLPTCRPLTVFADSGRTVSRYNARSSSGPERAIWTAFSIRWAHRSASISATPCRIASRVPRRRHDRQWCPNTSSTFPMAPVLHSRCSFLA